MSKSGPIVKVALSWSEFQYSTPPACILTSSATESIIKVSESNSVPPVKPLSVAPSINQGLEETIKWYKENNSKFTNKYIKA